MYTYMYTFDMQYGTYMCRIIEIAMGGSVYIQTLTFHFQFLSNWTSTINHIINKMLNICNVIHVCSIALSG